MWVSAIGAPHLVDPSRLERSARRLYGDAFDELWGELAPVPEENVHIVGEPVAGLESSPRRAMPRTTSATSTARRSTPATRPECGSSRAVRSLPPTPPPDVDVEAWYRTLDEIERRAPERLALIHFGVADDVSRHLAELRERLDPWAGRVEEGYDRGGVHRGRPGRPPAGRGAAYDRAMPFWQSYRA